MVGAGGVALLTAAGCAANSEVFGDPALPRALASLEAESGGRLGVAVLDTGSGRRFALHGDERFPICSTFKFLLAAAVLARVDQGRESLDRALPVTVNDIVTYSPVTERFVGRSARVAELCEATMILSDNAAANLLLAIIGGPPGFTQFARDIGDPVTRLDRFETALNEAVPGDPRDTSTPNAMLANLDRLVLGSALAPASRERITGWLVGNRTGDTRLRAGLPKGWRVGDKTGTGERGTNNDIAVIWPTNAAPVLLASYLTLSSLDNKGQNAIHAGVARAVAAALTG